MVVEKGGLQTATGFLLKRDATDIRSRVGKIELGSPAAKAGLHEGDRIDKINISGEWRNNSEVLLLSVPNDRLAAVIESLQRFGPIQETSDPSLAGETTMRLFVEKAEENREAFESAQKNVEPGRNVVALDRFKDLLNNWPRGRNSVQFVVNRDGQEMELPAFTPRTIGLHPTQTYETISMLLLVFLLLSFYPFRRHDGEVWVLFMIAYACHRFLNEMLRTEPVEALKMTLSQNMSLFFVIAAVGIEIYLWKTQKPLRRSSEREAVSGV